MDDVSAPLTHIEVCPSHHVMCYVPLIMSCAMYYRRMYHLHCVSVSCVATAFV